MRGTALEYLESVLPPPVRYLEPDHSARRAGTVPRRDREQVLEDQLRSNQSTKVSIEELRRSLDEGAESGEP